MRTTSLGGTGIEITEFIFGAGSIGGIGSPAAMRGLGISAEQGLARLTEAHALGIRVIDTADAYGGGESERTVGRWLAAQRSTGVLVQTKVGNFAGSGTPGVNLTGPYIERQLARSLERLGRVDLYLSHGPDSATPVEQTLTAFAAAKEAGFIRAFGASNVGVTELESLLDAAAKTGLPRPEWVQNGLSLLNRQDEHDLLPLIEAEGLGYMAYSPLAGGVLSDRYLDGASPGPGSRIAVAGDRNYPGAYSAGNLTRVAQLREVAREQGISTAGLALAWLRARPAVTAPIVSPSTSEQWQAVREALDAEIDDEVFDRVSGIFS